MFEFLNRLRQKPESVRRRILLTTTSMLTAAIFFLWLAIFSRTVLHKAETPAPEKETAIQTTKAPKGIFGEKLDTLKDMLLSAELEYARPE